jgi:para-nitrobenzyl esterase
LRWKPPQAAPTWQGVRTQVTEGPGCPQTEAEASFVGTASKNEDCLNLDVYRAVNTDSKGAKPVMVYFFGGSFLEGTADHYDGAGLVRGGDVIVVVPNYRVGAMGSLTLPGLSAESDDGVSGNYGIQDQIAALRWVRDNIRAFGGDPDNVTIFGQSAGGQSVSLHIVSPLSSGLFAKAIIQSGVYIPLLPTLAQKTSTGQEVAAAVGCTQDDPGVVVACMRALPVGTILSAQGLDNNPAGQLEWEPTQGGSVLPTQPLFAIDTGQFSKVPVLLGTTHDEARVFAAESFDLLGGPLTASGYIGALTALFAGFPVQVNQVAAEYPLSAYPAPDLAYAQVFTDAAYACLGNFAADLLVQHNVPVHEYEESDEGEAHLLGEADPNIDLAAAHTGDVIFLFPNNLKFAAQKPAVFTTGEAALSRAMIRAWTNFAKSGSPSALSAAWPALGPNGTKFVEELTPEGLFPIPTRDFLSSHKCQDWDPIYESVLTGSQ